MSKMPNLTWAADTILKVQLNNNNITEFDPAMTSGLNILRELHLDGNLISSFSLEIVNRFPALEKLNLQNNQLLSLQDMNVPLTAEVSSILFLHPSQEIYQSQLKNLYEFTNLNISCLFICDNIHCF